jgi:hypothetical protein
VWPRHPGGYKEGQQVPGCLGGKGADKVVTADQTRSSVSGEFLCNLIYIIIPMSIFRLSRSKVSGKRLTSGRQSVYPVIVSNSPFDPEQSSSDTPLGPAGGGTDSGDG